MKLQQLYSYTRKGIDDFDLIDTGDHIAIGISGGKDSLALLYAMAGLQKFYPKSFSLEAVAVHLGFEELDFTPIQTLCGELGVPFHVVQSNIAEIIFKERRETNPCSLCAKMRKGAFNEKAKALGCNKLAYAHHKNDFVETLMMSMIYEGRYHCFPPKIYLDRTELTLIRPMIYLDEKDIIGFQNKMNLPVIKNPCPADGYTRRQYVKELLHQINIENPGARDRIFHALLHSGLKGYEV